MALSFIVAALLLQCAVGQTTTAAPEITTTAAPEVPTTPAPTPQPTPNPTPPPTPAPTPNPTPAPAVPATPAPTTPTAPPEALPSVNDTSGNGTNSSNATDVMEEVVEFVLFSVYLPLSAAEFVPQTDAYRDAIAEVAGVAMMQVVIDKVTETDSDNVTATPAPARRRLLAKSIVINTKILVLASGQSASTIAGRLTGAAIRDALQRRSLPGASLSVPAVVAGASIPCGFPLHSCTPIALPPLFLAIPDSIPSNFTQDPRAEPGGMELGPCVCDLTIGVCDVNCNCDLVGGADYNGDCTETEELSVFSTDYGVPLKREAGPAEIPLCLPRDQFLKINAPFRLEDSPLCVLKNNNPSVGVFLSPPGGSVTNDKVRVEFSALGYGPSMPFTPTPQPTIGAYKVGMQVPIAFSNTRLPGQACNTASNCFPALIADGAFLALPYPGQNGQCVLGNTVKYWGGTADPEPCTQGGLAADMCREGSMLSPSRYISGVFIAKQLPGQDMAEWAVVDKWIQIEPIVKVVQKDAQGVVTNVFRAAGVPLTSYDNVTKRCTNILEQMHLTFERSGAGAIVSAKASITLSHVPVASLAERVSVLQRFSAQFVDSGTALLTEPETYAAVQKSGNPGYVDGLPVRAGLLEENATNADISVIREYVEGLRVPRMAGPDGRCVVCANGTSDGWDCAQVPSPRETVPVLFNEALEQGCTISLNRRELEAFCKKRQLHPLLEYDETLRIGIWGDSDNRNVFEWLPNVAGQNQLADNPDRPAGGQGYDPRGNCTNVIAGQHIQILTADAGNVKNPQSKILGVRLLYETENWITKYPDPTTRAVYSIRSSVSFVKIKDGGSSEVIPPPPSILPQLPDDIFYPFQISASARTASGPPWGYALLALTCCALQLRR